MASRLDRERDVSRKGLKNLEKISKESSSPLTKEQKEWQSIKGRMVEYLNDKGYKVGDKLWESEWLGVLEREFYSPLYASFPFENRNALLRKFDRQELKKIEDYIVSIGNNLWKRTEFSTTGTISQGPNPYAIPDSVVRRIAQERLEKLDNILHMWDIFGIAAVGGASLAGKGGRIRATSSGSKPQPIERFVPLDKNNKDFALLPKGETPIKDSATEKSEIDIRTAIETGKEIIMRNVDKRYLEKNLRFPKEIKPKLRSTDTHSTEKDAEPEFMRPLPEALKVAEEVTPPRPGRIISEWKAPDGMVIDMEVGSAIERIGLEQTLPSGTEVNLKGWQRAHSVGPGLGAESGQGIRYAPPAVNLDYQNSGIERFIRDFSKEKLSNSQLFLRTVTETHPNSLRLKSITYRLSAGQGKAPPTILFEVKINIENATNNPRISLDKPEILGEWTKFLAPGRRVAPPGQAAPSKSTDTNTTEKDVEPEFMRPLPQSKLTDYPGKTPTPNELKEMTTYTEKMDVNKLGLSFKDPRDESLRQHLWGDERHCKDFLESMRETQKFDEISRLPKETQHRAYNEYIQDTVKGSLNRSDTFMYETNYYKLDGTLGGHQMNVEFSSPKGERILVTFDKDSGQIFNTFDIKLSGTPIGGGKEIPHPTSTFRDRVWIKGNDEQWLSSRGEKIIDVVKKPETSLKIEKADKDLRIASNREMKSWDEKSAAERKISEDKISMQRESKKPYDAAQSAARRGMGGSMDGFGKNG